LTPGVTFSSVHLSDSGATASGYPVGMDIKAKMKNFYAEFERGKLYLGAELKETPIRFGVAKSLSMVPQRAWFILGSYHLTNKLTAGAYYSQFLNDKTVSNDPSRFSKDTVVSSRFDANQYFYFKLEGHYIHGNGEGFYPVGNAPVLQKNTRLLVARVGFTF
jgi:hypothetical protein